MLFSLASSIIQELFVCFKLLDTSIYNCTSATTELLSKNKRSVWYLQQLPTKSQKTGFISKPENLICLFFVFCFFPSNPDNPALWSLLSRLVPLYALQKTEVSALL